MPIKRTRKRCKRPSPSSESESEDELNDAGLREERNEDVTALTMRLRDPNGDMVMVHVGDDISPLSIQRALLSRISPKIKQRIEQTMAHDGIRHVRFDAPAAVVKVFLYWLFHDRLPTLAQFHGCSSVEASEQKAQQQYQILLIKTWMFANDTGLPAMQNTVMRHFFEGIQPRFLSEHVLQEGLLKTRRAMPMRMALLGELIWIDDVMNSGNTADEEEDVKLLDLINIDYVDGFNQDYEHAMEAYAKRHKRRATADDYLVKEV